MQIADISMPWRDRLRPASFRGAEFFVEVATRSSGRRLVPFEYPKRDDPYVEDMGRAMRRFRVSAYLIGPDYLTPKDALISALEQEGPGLLVTPLMGEMTVASGPYNVNESRQAGGFCVFEIDFFEAGKAGNETPVTSTARTLDSRATQLETAAVAALDSDLAAA